MADRQNRLEGEIAIVTGGAQGIGRAVVETFVAQGARVGLLDVDEMGGAEVARNAAGVLFVRCDVTAQDEVERAVVAIEHEMGNATILVNNAGISSEFDPVEMTDAEWERVFAVDLKAVWLCIKQVLPAMRRRGSGSIVNMSSIHARMTSSGTFPYPAAKSAVCGLTRSLALDEGPNGIRVNAVCPGYTRTRLVQDYFDRQPDPLRAEQHVLGVHPLGRIATPAEIANVVAFIASNEASFMTGAEVPVDGGLSSKFAS